MNELGAQCPNCNALFQVFPDLLRLHNGYAVCGSCTTAFDAIAVLQLLPEHQIHFINTQNIEQTDGLPILNAQVDISPALSTSVSPEKPANTTNIKVVP